MASGRLEKEALLNDRYRIQRVIGQGGMGTVYLAEHERLGTIVAVKEVVGNAKTEAEKEQALKQVEIEARLLVKLNHPNLPKVTDAFVENERCYIVMEYVEGVTLDTRFKEAGKPLDVAEVVDWALQIADVLAYLHSQDPPIIFRDLKPANVMVQPDGSIRLIDFGIARRFQPGASKDTALFGSVGYSPPEQFGTRQTDARADIYAFGASLHHLLTGRDPAADPFKWPPARSLNPAIPESLSQVIQACLAIDPDHRPDGMHQVALSLLAVREELRARTEAERASSGPVGSGAARPTSGKQLIPSAGLLEQESALRKSTSGRSSASVGHVPRAASAAPGGVASAAAGDARSREISRLLLALCLLVIVAGVTVVALKMRHKVVIPPSSSNRAPINVPQVPPVDPGNSAHTPPVHPDPGHVDTPPGADAAVQTEMVPLEHGFSADASGQPVFWLHVRGSVHMNPSGQPNAQPAGNDYVAVYLFDRFGNSLPARTKNGQYSDKGALYASNVIQVSPDDGFFETTLKLPVSEFPDNTPPQLKFQCKLYLKEQLAKTSDFFDLNWTPPLNTGAPTTLPGAGGDFGRPADPGSAGASGSDPQVR